MRADEAAQRGDLLLQGLIERGADFERHLRQQQRELLICGDGGRVGMPQIGGRG